MDRREARVHGPSQEPQTTDCLLVGGHRYHQREKGREMPGLLMQLYSIVGGILLANYNRCVRVMTKAVLEGDPQKLVALSLLVTRLPESVGKPFETLVETITRRSARGLDVLDRLVSERSLV